MIEHTGPFSAEEGVWVKDEPTGWWENLEDQHRHIYIQKADGTFWRVPGLAPVEAERRS